MSRKKLITTCVVFGFLAIFWGWSGISNYIKAEAFNIRVISAALCSVLSAIVIPVYIKEYKKNKNQ